MSLAATGQFVRVNRAACAMVGYSEAELLAMTSWELVLTLPRQTLHERIARLKGCAGQVTHDVVRHKDGRELTVWTRAHLDEARGHVYAYPRFHNRRPDVE